jgi:hypothetical protein
MAEFHLRSMEATQNKSDVTMSRTSSYVPSLITCLTRPTINHNRKLSLDKNKYLQKTQKLCTTKTQETENKTKTNGAEHLKLNTRRHPSHIHLALDLLDGTGPIVHLHMFGNSRAKTVIENRRCCPSRNTDAEYRSPEPPVNRYGPYDTVINSLSVDSFSMPTTRHGPPTTTPAKGLTVALNSGKCIRTGQHHRPTPTRAMASITVRDSHKFINFRIQQTSCNKVLEPS